MGIPELLEEVNKINPTILALLIIGTLVLAVFLFGFPREAVMIFSGYQFGLLIGSIINLFGMFVGAGFGYLIGSHGRTKVENTSKTVYMKYQRAFEENGIKALTALRLTPFSPHDTISIISGFIKLNQKLFFLISFFSFMPYALLWSFVGETFFDQIIAIVPTDYNISIWLYGLIAFIIIVTVFVKVFLNISPDPEHNKEVAPT
ncbi:MAG: TVP38/TMEM64 family protein [Candidatus Kariarchaeaceae archaeon]